MATIAGLDDLRKQGPPADIGTFQLPCSVMVFKYTFSGTDYYYAIRSGARGWVLVNVGADPATVINVALADAGAHDVLLLLLENWTITTSLSVPAGVHLHGVGWRYSLNYDAGGNCVTINGDDVKVSDLKIVIVAGAGAGGSRPNCIYADSRTNLEVRSTWTVGDTTVGDDGSNLRQCGIVFSDVTDSNVHNCTTKSNMRHGIYLVASSNNNTVSGNICNDNTRDGAFAESSANNTFYGNICKGNARYGISLYAIASISNTVSGNICNGNTLHGIYITYSTDSTVSGNTCNENDVLNTGTYDGISLNNSTGNIVSHNTCKDNDRRGIMVDADSDFNKVHGNYTSGNTAGSINIANANCNSNQIEWNTVEEGAPADVGTTTRSYGNYDPSANAFVGDVGAVPF